MLVVVCGVIGVYWFLGLVISGFSFCGCECFVGCFHMIGLVVSQGWFGDGLVWLWFGCCWLLGFCV